MTESPPTESEAADGALPIVSRNISYSAMNYQMQKFTEAYLTMTNDRTNLGDVLATSPKSFAARGQDGFQ
jgi:hypothetical protein